MKLIDQIDSNLAAWIARQHVFFVATAPLAANGHVNVSPKGGDSFRMLGPREAAYLDFTGSGAETIAHLRENGRITIMFCAFDGKPNIVRLHGAGRAVLPGELDFARLTAQFPDQPGTRAVIHVQVERISTSCGHGVPLMDFRADRDLIAKWSESKGADGLAEYRRIKNAKSIDGLPAL